jgi:hypothetical protein
MDSGIWDKEEEIIDEVTNCLVLMSLTNRPEKF